MPSTFHVSSFAAPDTYHQHKLSPLSLTHFIHFSYLSDGLTFAHRPYDSRPLYTLPCSMAERRIKTQAAVLLASQWLARGPICETCSLSWCHWACTSGAGLETGLSQASGAGPSWSRSVSPLERVGTLAHTLAHRCCWTDDTSPLIPAHCRTCTLLHGRRTWFLQTVEVKVLEVAFRTCQDRIISVRPLRHAVFTPCSGIIHPL